MSLTDLVFQELSDTLNLNSFDCDDEDINDFLRNDALKYQSQKMANTYVFLKGDEVVAFFSISNDCLNDLGVDKGYSNTIWNRFHRRQKIPNEKRIKQYPSIKIGRLGIGVKYHRTGLSDELMQFIKGWSIIDHKPAVRLLLLDAYNKKRQINYYKRNGFDFILDSDENSRTRIMLYDLMQLI